MELFGCTTQTLEPFTVHTLSLFSFSSLLSGSEFQNPRLSRISRTHFQVKMKFNSKCTFPFLISFSFSFSLYLNAKNLHLHLHLTLSPLINAYG
ncbi:hypothetical protein RJT34_20417 [Clitoria ternatea]|uniref:Uncharacterized protein n=1 Tax=Clitoria ternatea TaxID=43366 RepID=A0AAN9ISS5_CLITE